jgi:uncharacterized alkaline shock family protein YloU
MEIYALVGGSGTGKSHRARMVTYVNNIDYIIDDGLLIKDSKVLVGKSAKEEENKIKAVKRAIFMEKSHAEKVKEVIEKQEIDSLLILGTSMKMIHRIIDTLGLEEPKEIINIEDIASPEEIKMAKHQRKRKGKHVIPVPTIEVKPKFSGYLMESLELLFSNQEDELKAEKTIVRPKFSYFGKLLIADQVMMDLIEHILQEDKRVINVNKVKVNQEEKGTQILIRLSLKYGLQLQETAKDLQLNIKELIEYSTGVNILKVDVEIIGLAV